MHMPVSPETIVSLLDVSGSRAPSLDPQSKSVAYLSDVSGTSQIWLKAVGAARRITDHPEPVSAFSWRPDGGQLLFLADHGGDERSQLFLLDVATAAVRPLTADPTTVHLWGAWSPDGSSIAYSSNATVKDSLDVHVMDIATGVARTVEAEHGYKEVLGFSPSGDQLLIRYRNGALSDQSLRLVSVETGKRTEILAGGKPVSFTSAKLFKNGGGVAVCDFEGDRAALWRFDESGRVVACLWRDDARDLDLLVLSPNQDRAVIAANDQGWSSLYLLDLDTGPVSPIPMPARGVVSAMAITGGGSHLLCAVDGATRPSSIWSVPLDGAGAECVVPASIPIVAVIDFIEPQVGRCESFDGEQISYFRYAPRGNAEKPMPTIFALHGGPELQWRPDFRPEVQWLASQGIQVIAPNVRGSTGYGRRFHSLDDLDRRLDSLRDVVTLRSELVDAGIVHPARCGIYGRSYGGFLVMSALTETPELWSLGANLYGIGNLFTHLLATGPWARQMRLAEYGDPQTDQALLHRISPVFRLDKVKAPLFMAHGDRDPRVPPGESETINSVMQGLGKACEFHRVRHEGHGFLRKDNARAVYRALADFVARLL